MAKVLNEILLFSSMAVFVTGDRARSRKAAHLTEPRTRDEKKPGSLSCRAFCMDRCRNADDETLE